MTAVLTIPQSVIFKKVGEETVLLDFERGVYYGLDSVGTRVWELIAEGRDVDAIADAMAEEYVVTREEVRSDVDALVGDLERNGLVTR